MQNMSTITAEQLGAMLDACSRPFREAGNALDRQRIILANVTESVEKYAKRAKVVEFARGFCTGMALTFLSLSAYALAQHNYSFALGFLGPAVAGLVGVWGFQMSRFNK